MRRINIVSSIVIMILALIALVWLIPNNVPSWHDPGDLPPYMMPVLSVFIFAITGLLIGISAWRKKDEDFDESQLNEAAETMSFGVKEASNLGLWLAASIVYCVLLKFAGFEVASGLLIAGGMFYGGLRNFWIIAAGSVVVPILIVQLSWHVLNIRLP